MLRKDKRKTERKIETEINFERKKNNDREW